MKKTLALISLILVLAAFLSSCYLIDVVFGPDYKEVTNNIFTHYIEMNLAVKTIHSNVTKQYESQGSGVIYKEDKTYYYVLTNNHVIKSDSSYPLTSYTITDCYGKEYKGTLLHSDPSYDLAVLRIAKSGENLCVVSFASTTPLKGTDVANLGTSNGLINSVTYGEVIGYEPVEIQDKNGNIDNSVSIPVIWHNAPMWGGGSGSALLNMNMELVGINFAVATDDQGRFVCGFAIGISHVREYLEKNDLM